MRPEKANIVEDLKEKLTRSPFVIVADYQNMNVNHFADLRTRLAGSGAEVHVVKNSFLRRAISDAGLADVTEQLTGQTAVVTGEKDAAPIAKILKSFATEFKVAAVKIGIVDKSVLSKEEINQIAELPSREVLLAQLLGLFLSPATKLVRVLNEPASAFARLLSAKAKDMPAEAPPPTEASPPAEAPAPAPAEAPAASEPAASAPAEQAAEETKEEPKAEETTAEAAAPAPEAKTEDAAPETAG